MSCKMSYALDDFESYGSVNPPVLHVCALNRMVICAGSETEKTDCPWWSHGK